LSASAEAARRDQTAASDRPWLMIALPSETALLSLVRDVAVVAARRAGFEQAVADGVGLAVDECATNVIEHAYKGSPSGTIEVRLYESPLGIRFEVRDSGASLDPRNMPKVDLERYAAERKTGGLGVHLMGKIMDSVTFRRDGDENVCCLVKTKRSPEGA
jgi:anti-sigma regulatory factor (Ser/Thr protein kinase)